MAIEKKTHFSIMYFLLTLFMLMAFHGIITAPKVERITYSEFKRLLKAHKIKEVVITPETISGVFDTKGTDEILHREKSIIGNKKGEMRFITARIDDPKLVQELEEAGVSFSGRIENKLVKFFTSWVLPILFFVFIWSIFIRKMGASGGLMAIGKTKAKVYMETDTKVTFDDVAGIDEAKEELKEVIEFLKSPEKYLRLGGKIPKGVLLVGPPGTGKTLLAKAVAGEAGVPFFSMSGSDFVEMFVGVGAARVRDLFNQAQQKAPCIIFIDELDALGKARGLNPVGGHDEREQTLNQLLVEMDGFDTGKGVIIMAATNRPEILDPALLRPGRFDRHIVVDKPDIKGREAILKVHIKGVKIAPDVDLKVIAASTPGFVGADLANLVNEAALLAARKNKDAVEMEDFEEAIERVLAGLEKKSRKLNEQEKKIVAYHESGHAIVAESLPLTDPVHKISIIPRGISALGYTLQLPTEDRYLLTKNELVQRLCVLLGGRVAEEIVFSEISTGAQNDLLRATEIAERMVREYGMSERLGLVTYEKERPPIFLGISYDTSRTVSEETARLIDEEVKRIIDSAYNRTKEILTENRDLLEKLATMLLEKEVVEGDELRRLFEEKAKTKEDGVEQD